MAQVGEPGPVGVPTTGRSADGIPGGAVPVAPRGPSGSTSTGPDTAATRGQWDPEPGFRVDGVLLLGGGSDDPVAVDGITLIFDDEGLGVVRTAGESPRVLPWGSLSTYVVEPWTGGVLPEWWIDPELNREGGDVDADLEYVETDSIVDPTATNRPVPHTLPGALISIKTPYATYRFLKPGGDADQLAPRVAALTRRHLGPSGVTTMTTVASDRAGTGTGAGEPGARTTWQRVQPVLIVALVVFLAVSVTLILLQSAGTIHLPFLGGSGAGGLGRPLRTR